MFQKKDIIKIRISGMGGQGILLSGYILGKAAVEYDGIQAVQTQSYGPEMRGSKCKSDIIFSFNNNPIPYPVIEKADILIAMSQDAWISYNKLLYKESLVFIDIDLVQIKSNSHKIYKIPVIKMANELGNRVIANIIMIGAVLGVTQLISQSAIKKAVVDSVPNDLRELNLIALQKGFKIGEEIIKETI
ncbi:MAG: 2-oxoacid:acceptor oxidoreductase family protein [Promethearchaeota archaeon]